MDTLNRRTPNREPLKAAQRRRVNLFVENYWIGGLERFYFDLINGLPVDQFEVTLFANPIKGWAERLRLFIHRPFQRIPYRLLTTSQLDYKLLSLGNRRLGAGLAFLCRQIARAPLRLHGQRTLRRLWQQYPAEVVHIINGGYPGAQGCLTAALAARAAGSSRIFMSVLSYPYPLKSRAEASLDRQITAAVNGLIPNSLTAGQGLMDLRQFSPDKVIPIQGGSAAPAQDREAGADTIKTSCARSENI